jgi:catechol 2,3-dioxygenase-like lactoylglutathione lyase family enzyme
MSSAISRIDHVGIYTDRPDQVFRFFTDDLCLPVAFPLATYPSYTTGSIALGNCFLEITKLGSPPRPDSANVAARYQILGFQAADDAMERAIAELDSRGVPRSGVVPFFAPDATDAQPIRLWDNVYLGDLLGTNLWQRLFLAATRRSTPRPSQARSPVVRRTGVALLLRSFPAGMPVLTAYYRNLEQHARAVSRSPLAACAGGVLGIEYVHRVTVAAADWQPWTRLTGSQADQDSLIVRYPEGPTLEVLASPRPGIRSITLRVASLAVAHEALRSRRISVVSHTAGLAFAIPGTQLTVALSSSRE